MDRQTETGRWIYRWTIPGWINEQRCIVGEMGEGREVGRIDGLMN